MENEAQNEIEDPGLSIDDALTYEKVREVMRPDDEVFLIAHYGYGYSFRQIADALDISRAYAFQRTKKALARVRKSLKVKGISS